MPKDDIRVGGLLAVDLRRMLTQKLFYIMLGISAILPILILVMTTAAGSTDAEIFTSVWQAIGSTDGDMSMDLTSMCNINLIYFLSAIFACLFTAEDFQSGYCKNLFAIRSEKKDYVFSKITVCFIIGALMLLAYFAGALVGGRLAGLSFAMEGFSVWNLMMSMISKVFVMAIFASIYVLMGVIAKRLAWLSILLSFTVGMFLFMVIPMMTPLASGLLNAVMCLAGGVLFSAGIGYAGCLVLKRTDIL